MCNLSEVVLERGIEQGIERGIKVGEERGEARGIRIGETRGEARVMIELGEMNKAGVAPEVIIEQLMKKFSETQELKE